MVVTAGLTTAEPEIPETVKLPLVQEVALVDLQESVKDFPVLIDVGLADSEAVGAGGGVATVTVADAVADPPFPEQVIE